MGLKRLVICGEDNEVLFDGASQSIVPPSTSGTGIAAEAAPPDERLTLPAPAPALDAEESAGDYDDDPPTLALNAVFVRETTE